MAGFENKEGELDFEINGEPVELCEYRIDDQVSLNMKRQETPVYACWNLKSWNLAKL